MSSLCSDIVIIVGSSIREAHIFWGRNGYAMCPIFMASLGFAAPSLVSTLVVSFACPLIFGSSLISQSLIDVSKSLQIILIHFFQIEHSVAGALRDSYQFVELELQCLSVPILGILNKEYH